ncbi:MAG: hypothetical protein KKD31_01615, partial [Bacteroidetes bacterium]|nr:hypothetical protein [Bacteroidota bacterium]
MKRWKKRAYSIACGVFGLIQLVQPGGLYGQSDSTLMSKLINRTNISGQWFLAWQYKQSDESNLFLFKRGYFNVATKMSDNFSLRFTQDITLDEEGMDAGNVEMRLKYLYLKAKPANSGFLRNSYFELGLVHRPWLSFVEDVNRYRVQGTMFAERYKVVNSADFGVLFVCLLGNGLNEEYQKNVSKNLPGKYGSFSLGLFNGGGYHAIEYNNNKTIEGRLSLRPLPEQMPGLQGNYAFAFGKGNTTLSPDFEMNLFA